MASTSTLDGTSTEHDLQLCGACTRDGASISAIKWCRDCREGLCEPCYTYHKKHKTSAKHVIVPFYAITDRELLASKLDIDCFCKSHNNEPLKLYCKTHNSFCCTLCAYSSHKDCKDLIPLDEVAKLCADQKLLMKQTQAFIDTKSQVQDAIDKRRTFLQDLDSDKLSILSRASDNLRKTKDKLDKLYRDFEKKIIKEHEEIKQTQAKMMSILLEFQKEVESGTATLQSLQHVTPVETLIMMEALKSNIVQRYEKVADTLKQNPNMRITYKLDTSITTLLDKLSSLGEIVKKPYGEVQSGGDVFSINKIKTGLDIRMIIGSPAQSPILPRKDLMTARVNFVKAVTSKDLNLKGVFWFVDGKYLDQGHLILVDHRNNRLVLLDENMKAMKEIKVNGEPIGVDVSDDGSIANVVCYIGSVHRYSLPAGQEVGRSMTVEQHAYGVVVTGDTTIIGHSGNKVALYDNKGQMMKSTTTYVSYPYIAISNNGQHLFYCEDDNGTVVACDKQLNVVWRYKCDNLRYPIGICVDSYDNVYIVGYGSNNIHQISGDGTRHRVLIQQMNNIRNPWGIAFHKTRDMFVVTSHENNGPLELYEFSP